MPDARAVVDPAAIAGAVDERLFGGLLEHMGRAIYGGIFEPGHPNADGDGWRRDVLDLVRSLGVTIVRYPGGNFVSGYDWEDGVGPRSARPPRADLAWHSMEPNLVGTDDFLAWTRLARTRPMLTVNLGSRGAEAAGNLVEYCNAPTGSRFADWRAANGHREPYGVETWCLGNEMDGPWQIGAKTAAEYGRLAVEAGTAMRLVDPSIELVACGSSGAGISTFGTWEETVLDVTWDIVDHVSLHAYFDPAAYPSLDEYLACPRELDRTIRTVVSIADGVASRRGSRKRIGVSVDEWNVWRLSEHQAHEALEDPGGPFRPAPPLAEDQADLADALVVGGLLVTLLQHADRVRIACVAQLVNVIPLIRTLDGGPAWRQTTSYPFADVARWARGNVLHLDLDESAIDAIAVHDPDSGRLAIFAVMRLDRPMELELDVRPLGDLGVIRHSVLADPDIRAANTADRPDRVLPTVADDARVAAGRLSVLLRPRSWNAILLTRSARP